MKIGDLVIVNVPAGGRRENWSATRGLIIDRQEMRKTSAADDGRCRVWWHVLRSDTGRIEKFHDSWMKAYSNESR
jgi:hypothetical protein